MLVITRKSNETLCIGGGITVTVVDVGGGKVRLAVAAPPGVRVLRRELLDREPKGGECSPAPALLGD